MDSTRAVAPVRFARAVAVALLFFRDLLASRGAAVAG
jgi:hypothetical protein